MGWNSFDDWPPYVPVAARRRQAAQKVAKMRKAGRAISPIEITGRKIARTFWGEAWCKNLESYSDYANRLPRGRSYVRHGSVIDLRIDTGRVRALVSGSEIYKVDIEIKPLEKSRWTDIKGQCAGQIDSLIELLKGSISKGVMEIVTRKGEGLFPAPGEISLSCSCPDWATMCKHVAATLYGVGARLDHEPELLFTLRGVDPTEMVEAAVDQAPIGTKPRRGRTLKSDELSSVFGVDIDVDESAEEVSTPARSAKRAKRTAQTKKDRAKKTTVKKAPTRKSKGKADTKPVAKKTAVKTPATRGGVAKKGAAKKGATEKTVAGKTPARKAAKKKAVPRKAAAKRATAKETAKSGIAAKRATARKAAKKKAVPGKTAAKKAAAKKSTPKKAVARKVAAKKAAEKKEA